MRTGAGYIGRRREEDETSRGAISRFHQKDVVDRTMHRDLMPAGQAPDARRRDGAGNVRGVVEIIDPTLYRGAVQREQALGPALMVLGVILFIVLAIARDDLLIGIVIGLPLIIAGAALFVRARSDVT